VLALIQRVTSSKVVIEGETFGEISRGILALIAIEKGDSKADARRLCERLLSYRIFPDEQDKMNLSISAIKGGLLLVPQFTLAADTQKGTRPSFSSAEDPYISKKLFEYFCSYVAQQYDIVETGSFGADMKVSLCNDGPVTFMLQVKDQ
jgi:D-tyrosyl-tRNA(Tyr) deacylase